jgi:hypothetical protein
VNRFGSRVRVAVAGMAALGMTATLAAQTHPATYPLNDVMQVPLRGTCRPRPRAWHATHRGCCCSMRRMRTSIGN